MAGNGQASVFASDSGLGGRHSLAVDVLCTGIRRPPQRSTFYLYAGHPFFFALKRAKGNL